MNSQQAINEYEEQLNKATEVLNEFLTYFLGARGEADWQNHVGETKVPEKYFNGMVLRKETKEQWRKLWLLREECNSAIAWVQEHHTDNQAIRVYLDGNVWCALIGDDLQSGTAGFGNTPAEAIACLQQAVAILPEESICPLAQSLKESI